MPWSTVRLLRYKRLGDLGALEPAWAGWVLNRNGLCSPDGRAYREFDLHRWWLLVEQARFWREDYHRRRLGGVGASAPADTLQIEAGEAVHLPVVAASPPIEATAPVTALFVLPVAAMPFATACAAGMGGPELPTGGVFQGDPAMLLAALAAQSPTQMQGLQELLGGKLVSYCDHPGEFVTAVPTQIGPVSNTGLSVENDS